jgi:segregation and condensation protein B
LPGMSCEPHEGPDEERGLPLKSLVESLLFVADEPVSIHRLAAVLEASSERIDSALAELTAEYEGRGFRLQRKDQSVQLVSAPEAADFVRRLLGIDSGTRLSPAALETLAIIAYRQPLTRGQIQAVRGVNSDSVLRTLLTQGLIEEQGRLEQVGRPIIYGTTFDFLQHFGLRGLEQLPPLDEHASDTGESERRNGGDS